MGMQKYKLIDFRVYYDIVKFTNNHAEWHERSGSMTARQPFPKGANASPKGTMRSEWHTELIDLTIV
jgi:hypothetical protein